MTFLCLKDQELFGAFAFFKSSTWKTDVAVNFHQLYRYDLPFLRTSGHDGSADQYLSGGAFGRTTPVLVDMRNIFSAEAPELLRGGGKLQAFPNQKRSCSHHNLFRLNLSVIVFPDDDTPPETSRKPLKHDGTGRRSIPFPLSPGPFGGNENVSFRVAQVSPL